MKKLLAVSALFAIGAMAETMNGYISDAHCGAKHSAEAPNEACVKSCAKRGTPAVFTLLCLLPVPAVALSLLLPEPGFRTCAVRSRRGWPARQG